MPRINRTLEASPALDADRGVGKGFSDVDEEVRNSACGRNQEGNVLEGLSPGSRTFREILEN
jgi:hypothetical protein